MLVLAQINFKTFFRLRWFDEGFKILEMYACQYNVFGSPISNSFFSFEQVR